MTQLQLFPLPVRKRATIPDRVLFAMMVRDSFTDRYTSERVYFPGALHLRSLRDPIAHPYHPNTGPFWTHYPSAEHIRCRTHGGSDDLNNLLTVAWPNNKLRSTRPLEKLGWTILPLATDGWDGDLCWFLDQVSADPALLANDKLRRWHRAACAWAA